MIPNSKAVRGSTEGVEPVGGPSSSRGADEARDRCARLSRGQLEVLRLVNRHLSSKEIAAQLGISSHTVDQRVRGAIRILGVSRRSEAARLVDLFDTAGTPAVAATEGRTGPYQRLIHQAPDIDAGSDPSQSEGAVSSQIRHADRTRGTGTGRLETEQSALHSRSSLLPWSTSQQASNSWGVGQRLAAIVTIAIVSSFSAGMLLAGLESLTRLLVR
ncbi:helix-turn-helix domain-containing protein [Sphingomonas glaciei]|uniref:Helix-turn-helix transcriptional regulator n=1 Tax=Sphingomonas glaciei TaxID=2938948 RepID=A0ABY5MVX4_9SPHN|nr:helix-turn-helix transcriptional regulator [Sphingomonas glaciei]UUR07609.1 helix-turn-helix transcriptional regulator [Sphingomonas glaciei]